MTEVASFRYYGTKVVLASPYSEALVATIKAAFPHGFREWDPERKLWTFYADALDGDGIGQVIGVCLKEGWSVRKIFPDGQRTTIYPTGEIVSEKQEDLFG